MYLDLLCLCKLYSYSFTVYFCNTKKFKLTIKTLFTHFVIAQLVVQSFKPCTQTKFLVPHNNAGLLKINFFLSCCPRSWRVKRAWEWIHVCIQGDTGHRSLETRLAPWNNAPYLCVTTRGTFSLWGGRYQVMQRWLAVVFLMKSLGLMNIIILYELYEQYKICTDTETTICQGSSLGGRGAGIEGGEGHYAVQLESGRNDSV